MMNKALFIEYKVLGDCKIHLGHKNNCVKIGNIENNTNTKCHTVENIEIYSHRKNSSNQLFSNFVSKSIVFTKFLPKKRESSRVNFRYFHSVHCTLSVEETSICFHEITEFFAKIS